MAVNVATEIKGLYCRPVKGRPENLRAKWWMVGIDEILWNADIKFKALKNYYKRIDADILFYFHDAVIQAEAMGARVKYSKEMMPVIEAPARVPRMMLNAQVFKRTAKEFSDKLRAAMVYGPFTVAGQVAGEEAVLRGIANDHKVRSNHMLKDYITVTDRMMKYIRVPQNSPKKERVSLYYLSIEENF